MPWVACESADKHAGGKNTNNNIEKMLLQREHFTEPQLSAATRDGPGASHPPLLLPHGFAPCCHCHCRGAALSWMPGGVFMGLPRHRPLTLLFGTAKLAGWHRESVGSDGERSCRVCRLKQAPSLHGWQGANSWAWGCPSRNWSVFVVPSPGVGPFGCPQQDMSVGQPTGRIRRPAA